MFSAEFFQYAHKLLNKIQTVKYNTILVNDNIPPVPVQCSQYIRPRTSTERGKLSESLIIHHNEKNKKHHTVQSNDGWDASGRVITASSAKVQYSLLLRKELRCSWRRGVSGWGEKQYVCKLFSLYLCWRSWWR